MLAKEVVVGEEEKRESDLLWRETTVKCLIEVNIDHLQKGNRYEVSGRWAKISHCFEHCRA